MILIRACQGIMVAKHLLITLCFLFVALGGYPGTVEAMHLSKRHLSLDKCTSSPCCARQLNAAMYAYD